MVGFLALTTIASLLYIVGTLSCSQFARYLLRIMRRYLIVLRLSAFLYSTYALAN